MTTRGLHGRLDRLERAAPPGPTDGRAPACFWALLAAPTPAEAERVAAGMTPADRAWMDRLADEVASFDVDANWEDAEILRLAQAPADLPAATPDPPAGGGRAGDESGRGGGRPGAGRGG